MQSYQFVVNERPYCIADWHLAKKNTAFLKGIDATYFRHVAEVHAAALEGDDQQVAAVNLRQAYSHGLEALFSLLCAAVQAPGCPLGWMLKYRNWELNALVEKIETGVPLLTRLPAPVTWERISETLHQFHLDDVGKGARIKAAFARLWARLAKEFLDPRMTDEYNSIKHGLRVRPGGFALSIGLEHEYGVAPPSEEMTAAVGSVFGSSYFAAEQVGGQGITFRPRSQTRSWVPAQFIGGLRLLEMSIANVVSFLRGVGGEDWTTLRYSWPQTEDGFDAPWSSHPNFEWMDFDTVIGAADVPVTTGADVLAEYETRPQ